MKILKKLACYFYGHVWNIDSDSTPKRKTHIGPFSFYQTCLCCKKKRLSINCLHPSCQSTARRKKEEGIEIVGTGAYKITD